MSGISLLMVAKIQFSIRSIMITTGSVAAVCALYAAIPLHYRFIPPAVFLAAFGVASASIGYDFHPRLKGTVVGAIVGLVIGFAVYLWLSQPVPRE